MIPTTNTTLYLKQLDFSNRNYNGLDVTNLVFPSFKDPIISMEDFQWLFFQDIKSKIKLPTLSKAKLTTEYRRRFDGGDSLDRGCYYSVCNDLEGNDKCTLVNELYAYSNFETSGTINLYDFAINELRERFLGYRLTYKANHSGIYILAVDNGVKKSPFIKKWIEAGLNLVHSELYPHLRFAIVYFPYIVSELNVDNILDLRQRIAQKWLINYIKENMKSIKLNFIGNEGYDWFLVLSLLMDKLHGGNVLTTRIGSVLRNKGINGLVFPSARSDCSVTYSSDKLIDFKGWNFVRYDSSDFDYSSKDERATMIPRFDISTMNFDERIEKGWYLNNIEKPFFDELNKKHKSAFE